MKLTTALSRSSILSAALVLAAGCAQGSDPEVDALADTDEGGALDPAGVAMNGPDFNGISLQGVQLNGISLQGVQLNGQPLDGLTMTGVLAHGMTPTGASANLVIQAGHLVAHLGDGTEIRGAMLDGLTLDGQLSNGAYLPLAITGVTSTADSEIMEYKLNYWDGSSWPDLCVAADGSPVMALALKGRWDLSSGTPTGGAHIDDPSLFTFACKNTTLAKCVGLGYAPWRSVEECSDSRCAAISMRDMHQACTRMMRADYCGDGTPHTVNGTLINIWDNFDVQAPDAALSVSFHDEAEWSPNGALCIEQVRWSGEAEAYINHHCPQRWTSPSFDCFTAGSTFFTPAGYGTPAASRSLLRNQFTHDSP